MTETKFSGPATSEEILTYIIKLARVTREAQKDAQLVRQEVRTALQKFEMENKSIATKTEQIQKSYAPESVENAVDAARAVLTRFERESKDVVGELRKRVDRVSRNLLMRTALWAVIASVCLAFAGWVVVKFVPSLTEIADRRAELQGLQDQIAAANRRVEALKDHLVLGTDGRWYVRYAPPVTLCPPSGPCGLHVPLP